MLTACAGMYEPVVQRQIMQGMCRGMCRACGAVADHVGHV